MMTIIISKGDIFDLSNSDISYPYIYKADNKETQYCCLMSPRMETIAVVGLFYLFREW